MKTKLVISIIASILLMYSAFTFYTQDHSTKWLWIAIAFFSILPVIHNFIRVKGDNK